MSEPVPVSRAELLELSGGDPWARWALPDPLAGAALVVADVALVERGGPRPGLWVAPLRPGLPAGAVPEGPALTAEAARVATALRLVREGLFPATRPGASISAPAEHAGTARAVLPLSEEGGDWDWMWTEAAPPPESRERLLVELDDRADAEELRAFAHAHNPRVWTRIGEGEVLRWVGVRDVAGGLVAVGGAEREASGAPHLAGILTAVPARGQGWGRVVSSALTREALREHGVCTLGMFRDNDRARRLYRGLGYRTARRWFSRRLAGN